MNRFDKMKIFRKSTIMTNLIYKLVVIVVLFCSMLTLYLTKNMLISVNTYSKVDDIRYDKLIDILSNNNNNINGKLLQPVYYSDARGDLAGAALQDMLMAQAYCYHHNLTYGGACFRKSSYWISKPRHYIVKLLKETLLDKVLMYSCSPKGYDENLILHEDTYRKDDSKLFTLEWKHNFLSLWNITNLNTNKSHSHRGNNLSSALKNVRAIRTISISLNESPSSFRIVVHVRRGFDIEPCHFASRYLPNSHYIRLIDKYRSILINNNNSTKDVDVIIYSESISHESFDIFYKRNYIVNLDSDIASLWIDIMKADVFIMSRSSFSYVPAILNFNGGRIVYTPFWHQPIPGWDIVDETLMQEMEKELQPIVQEACSTADTYLARFKTLFRWIIKNYLQ